MSRIYRLVVLSLVPMIFFTAGVLTLGDYGVNGDETRHFERGQSFLHFFLTGSKTYDNLPGYAKLVSGNQAGDSATTDVASQATLGEPPSNLRLSAFQYRQPASTAALLFANDIGHPPLNDILAAASNKVFYQWLGWLGDLESHHLFEIFIATLGVLLIMYWAYLEFGFVAALVAGLALALHPMYLGESRFNIKDPIETAAYGATLFFVWQALRPRPQPLGTKQLLGWFLGAGFAGGLALGTKFNVFIVLPTVGLWCVAVLLYLGIRQLTSKLPRDSENRIRHTIRQWLRWPTIIGIFLAGCLAVSISFASWPYLWEAPFAHFEQVIGFYRGIGTGAVYTSIFLSRHGWNLYPLLDVVLRTPLITLLLACIGIAAFVRYWHKSQLATLLLWVIWLVIPILRVSLPGSSIYGATRQIMEYIPAMALFAGVGAAMLVDSLSGWFAARASNQGWKQGSQTIVTVMLTGLILSYLPIVVTLTRLHPNPQLFYNSLIGGLQGAYAINFPFWYNTMGNVYASGIDWLNVHAEPNAKLTTVFDSGKEALPPGRLRADVQVGSRNTVFSQKNQAGEYIMSLIPYGASNWTTAYASSMTRYLERFLEPVYTYEVEGVPLLRIWKNDPEHQRRILAPAHMPVEPVKTQITKHSLLLDFGQTHQFDRIEITPANLQGCQAVSNGYLTISLDGKTWERIDNISEQMAPFAYSFAGDLFRYLSIEQDENSCMLTPSSIQGYIYEQEI